MKRHVLKLIVLSLGFAAVAIVGNVAQQKSHAQEPAVEQVHKNIQVLKGLPESQLIATMEFFETSLGVECNYCHINEKGQWDPVSDIRPAKATARVMIKMVLDTNRNTFRGQMEISCYTCHRGRTSPQAIPNLPLAIPSPRPKTTSASGPAVQASPVPIQSLPSADEILNKYIQALGGQQAIDRLKSRVSKGTISLSNGISVEFEQYQSAPDKFYQIVKSPFGTNELGFNGTTGWIKTPRGVNEIKGQSAADLDEFKLLRLKDELTRTRVTGKDKIGDREVYVLAGETLDGKRIRLFLDTETGLLVRRITYTTNIIAVIPAQIDFADYREVDGIRFPFSWQISSIDFQVPVSAKNFTDIKINVPVDDSKFNMPTAKPTP